MSVMPGDYASAPGALQGLFSGDVAEGFSHRDVINAKDQPVHTLDTAVAEYERLQAARGMG